MTLTPRTATAPRPEGPGRGSASAESAIMNEESWRAGAGLPPPGRAITTRRPTPRDAARLIAAAVLLGVLGHQASRAPRRGAEAPARAVVRPVAPTAPPSPE